MNDVVGILDQAPELTAVFAAAVRGIGIGQEVAERGLLRLVRGCGPFVAIHFNAAQRRLQIGRHIASLQRDGVDVRRIANRGGIDHKEELPFDVVGIVHDDRFVLDQPGRIAAARQPELARCDIAALLRPDRLEIHGTQLAGCLEAEVAGWNALREIARSRQPNVDDAHLEPLLGQDDLGPVVAHVANRRRRQAREGHGWAMISSHPDSWTASRKRAPRWPMFR